MNKKGEGEVGLLFGTMLLLVVLFFISIDVYYTIWPTKEMVEEKAANELCDKKCYPNYGIVRLVEKRARCFCSTKFKEAK